jgi:DNA invertase Pin-like site-specific DNA recombinase
VESLPDPVPPFQVSSTRRRFEIYCTRDDEAKLSDTLRPVTELRLGAKVVLYCRVSGDEQERNGNLARQVADMQAEARARGLNVVDVSAGVWPAWDEDRLFDAVCLASRHGAVLLAHTADRFVRNKAFWKSKQRVRPVGHDIARLRCISDGVALYTLMDPDAPPAVIGSAQKRRGQRTSGHRGGRPVAKRPGYKKRRREELRPRVVELLRQKVTVRAVAHATNVPRSTVNRWTKESGSSKQALPEERP